MTHPLTARHLTAAFVLLGALALAACSSTVVRTPGAGGTTGGTASGRPGSVPQYGKSAKVQKGDTLYALAVRNGVDFRDLAAWNSIPAPYTIYPGQSLRLYPAGGQPPRGGTVAGTPGTPGAKPPMTGTVGTIATGKPGIPPTAKPPVNSGFSWRWPATGPVVGNFVAGDATQQGVDIAGSAGQPVNAAADGVVVYSGAGLVGYGELVIIKHSDAWLSAYGHNRKRLVNEGQNVKAGQQIAEMGHSGASRDMLHFEIRYNGKPVDPMGYLPGR